MTKFTRDDIAHFHDTDIHLPSRTISLVDGIFETECSKLIKNIHMLNEKSNDPITLKMATTGGFVYDMWAIHDAIKESNSKVTIVVYGYCMSAGTVILQAASKRILSPNTRFMMHYGSEGSYPTHSKDFQRSAKESEVNNEMMEKIYLDRIQEKQPSFTLKKLKDMIQFDKYLSAQETVDLGLADSILGE